MKITPVSDTFSVTGQIGPDDVAALAEAGFRSVICFRPDGEGGPAQPAFASVEAAAKTAGLPSRYIPTVPGRVGPSHVADTSSALKDLPKPILAYCASGARAQALYQAASR